MERLLPLVGRWLLGLALVGASHGPRSCRCWGLISPFLTWQFHFALEKRFTSKGGLWEQRFPFLQSVCPFPGGVGPGCHSPLAGGLSWGLWVTRPTLVCFGQASPCLPRAWLGCEWTLPPSLAVGARASQTLKSAVSLVSLSCSPRDRRVGVGLVPAPGLRPQGPVLAPHWPGVPT